ncbi:DUF928 domain-containing protein [Cylindrospermum sp. FACHB-282]|uniref:DUF928 domain-containing protein n=1 Tax=Cylindrospermum sp. FACHB-282 TaxID=2692794 RepID=UPI001686FB38|nr:DUF928 domain-containing protein [Cylindrospermum sp. FACHB-282]MBD2386621.1 DUF928 domain-containing protein [Cylindrospermum sp. FACHB-282]
MTYSKWLLHKLFDPRLLTSCVLSMTLGITQTALAGYQPPRDQKPPSGHSDSSGVRGVQSNRRGRLAPVTHLETSAALHPSFTWFLPDGQALLIEFSLYEFDTDLKPKKLNKYTRQLQGFGIMKLSWPRKMPVLTMGKRYLWQLHKIYHCKHRYHNLVARSEIKVVHKPLTFLTILSATSDRPLKANLYGPSAMWYNTMSQVLTPAANDQLLRVVASVVKSLANLEKLHKSRQLTDILIKKI